jgi:hypothetical protein
MANMVKTFPKGAEYIAFRDASENYRKAVAIREKHFDAWRPVAWDDLSKAEEYSEAWSAWWRELKESGFK